MVRHRYYSFGNYRFIFAPVVYMEGYDYPYPTWVFIDTEENGKTLSKGSGIINRGKVKWHTRTPVPEEVKEHINKIVEEDHTEFKKRWYPLFQED